MVRKCIYRVVRIEVDVNFRVAEGWVRVPFAGNDALVDQFGWDLSDLEKNGRTGLIMLVTTDIC